MVGGHRKDPMKSAEFKPRGPWHGGLRSIKIVLGMSRNLMLLCVSYLYAGPFAAVLSQVNTQVTGSMCGYG